MGVRNVVRWGNFPVGVYAAPVYLGLERGAFGPPGVRIEVTDNLTGADYTENLVAGRFDMGHMGTPPLCAALARTDDYVIVGQGVMRAACFYLIAPREVSPLRGLAGKAIALNKLRTCPHSIIRTLLRREGMRESDVVVKTLVEGVRINEAFERGEVAAAVSWEPYVSQAEREFAWRVLADGRRERSPGRSPRSSPRTSTERFGATFWAGPGTPGWIGGSSRGSWRNCGPRRSCPPASRLTQSSPPPDRAVSRAEALRRGP